MLVIIHAKFEVLTQTSSLIIFGACLPSKKILKILFIAVEKERRFITVFDKMKKLVSLDANYFNLKYDPADAPDSLA